MPTSAEILARQKAELRAKIAAPEALSSEALLAKQKAEVRARLAAAPTPTTPEPVEPTESPTPSMEEEATATTEAKSLAPVPVTGGIGKAIKEGLVEPATLWLKELAGHTAGTVAGMGPGQDAYIKALANSDRAKAAKAAGLRSITILAPNVGEPGFGPKEVPVDRAILSDATEAEFKKRLSGLPGVKQAYSEQKESLQEAKKKPVLDNFQRDVGDIQKGTFQLLNTLAQTGQPPEKRGFQGAFEQGLETGAGLLSGAVGGGAALAEEFVKDPWGTFKAAPVTVASTAVPAGRAIGRGGKALLPAKVIDKAGGALDALPRPVKAVAKAAARGVETGAVGATLGGDIASTVAAGGLAALAPGLAAFLGFMAPETVASFKRWFIDRASQSTEGATQVVREILSDPDRVRSEVESLTKEAAGRVRQGLVEPEPDYGLAVFDYRATGKPPGVAQHIKFDEEGNLVRAPDPAKERVALAEEAPADTARQSSLPPNAPPLTEGRGVGGDPVARDLAAGVASKVPGGEPRLTTTLDPVFEQTVDRVRTAMEDAGVGGPALPREKVAARYTEALQQNSIELLRSPEYRKRVIKALYLKNKVKPSRDQVAQLDSVLQDLAEGNAPDSSVGGNLVSELVGEVSAELQKDPKVRAQAQADVLESIGKEQANTAAEARLNQLIKGEQDRFTFKPGEIDPVSYMLDTVEKLAKGERVPLILPDGVDPRAFAQYIRTKGAPLLQGLPAEANKALLKFANQLDKDYVRSKIPQVHTQWVHKGFESSVAHTLTASKAIKEIGDLTSLINNHLKGAVTARNIPSNLNNLASNIVYQTIRTGRTPLELIESIHEAGKGWLDYQAGKITDPAKLRMYRALGRTGLMDTGLIDGELGMLGAAYYGKSLPGKVMSKLFSKLEESYKLGDVVFKADEAVRGFNKLLSDLGDLGDGKSIKFKDSKVNITRQGDKYSIEGPSGKKVVDIDSQDLADVLAQESQRPARVIFFDYTDVPLFNQWLRTNPVAALSSPFYTWGWKSMDIPGMKKGLINHLLDYDGGNFYTTNDSGLNARNAGRSGLTAGRRAAILGATGAITPKVDEKVQRAMQFDPTETPVGVMYKGDKPLDVVYKDWSNNNLFAQSDLVLRLGQKGLQSVFGLPEPNPEEYQKLKLLLDKKEAEYKKTGKPVEGLLEAREELIKADKVRELWVKNNTGLFSINDGLRLAGLEGGMIYKFLHETLGGDNRGRPPTTADITRELTRMMLGGTPAAIIDVIAGNIDPADDSSITPYFSSRGRSYDTREPEVEPAVRWSIRKLFGVGYKHANAINRTSQYLAATDKALNKSATTEAQRQFDREIVKIRDAAAKGKITPPEEKKASEAALAEKSKRLNNFQRIIAEEMGRLTTAINEGTQPFTKGTSAEGVSGSLRDASGHIKPPEEPKATPPKEEEDGDDEDKERP